MKRHLYSAKREESIEPTVSDEPSPELARSESDEAEPAPHTEDEKSASDEMTPSHELIATLSAQEAQLYSALAASPQEERRRGSKHDTQETPSSGDVPAHEDDLHGLSKEQLVAMIRELQGKAHSMREEWSDQSSQLTNNGSKTS